MLAEFQGLPAEHPAGVISKQAWSSHVPDCGNGL